MRIDSGLLKEKYIRSETWQATPFKNITGKKQVIIVINSSQINK